METKETKRTEAITPPEAAVLLGVSPRTIRNWIMSGRLPGRRHPLTGRCLLALEDVQKLRQLVVKEW
jgi:excisionase family DNA binding protein